MESEKTTPRATKPTVVAAYCRHYASRVPSSGIIRDTCSQNTYSLDFEPMEVNVDIAEQARFEQLEKEVKILNLKLEGLIDYLNVGRSFGPPSGRQAFDQMIKSILDKANLSK